LKKLAVVLLFCLGISAVAIASQSPAPEIDPSSGANALALIGAAMLIFRGRRQK
jgi:hypothetical protein